jgi:hypothetical protein
MLRTKNYGQNERMIPIVLPFHLPVTFCTDTQFRKGSLSQTKSVKEQKQVFLRIHPFCGRPLDRGDSKGQDGSFKSLLLDSSMKTRGKSDTGIRYGIVSAGSGQAEASRDGQEAVEMR